MESIKSSQFVFVYAHLLYYRFHKINTNRGGSYIDSPDWIKNKKASINPINKKDKKCFQYVVTVELNHEDIKKDSSKISSFRNIENKHDVYRGNDCIKKFCVSLREHAMKIID